MNGLRVLFVDDEDVLRSALAEALREDGFDVTEAGSVAQALEEAARTSPDCIVTDLRLPDGTGIDLMRRLRAEGCAAHAVVASGFGSFENAVDAMHLGVARFLSKPFSYDQLAAAVRESRVRDAAGAAGGMQIMRGASNAVTALRARAEHRIAQLCPDVDAQARACDLVEEALRNIESHAYPMEPGPVAVRVELEGDVLAITVADEGCGFDASSALAASLRKPAPYCGGLARMHQFADDLVVKSTPGAGTSVTLRFRVHEAAAAVACAPSADDFAVALLWS